MNPFKWIYDTTKGLVDVETPTPQKAMIPYASGLSSQTSTNYSGKLMGEVDVRISVDQNGKVTQQPTRTIPLVNQGGLR